MFDKIPQKDAIIFWNEKDNRITDFLVLYEFTEEDIEKGSQDNDYIRQKAKSMSYSAGNAFADWEKCTPAYIIFEFLLTRRFASADYFLRAFDELMKINEVSSELLKTCPRNVLYQRIEDMAFQERFPWAKIK